MGLKVSSLGERGLQKGWHSFSKAAPRFKKNASEAYIWKKISGIWLAHILTRPALACIQLPNQESSRWRVSPDRCNKFLKIWCSLSWNWPINYNKVQRSLVSHVSTAKIPTTRHICLPGGYWPPGLLSPGHLSERDSGNTHVPPPHLGFLTGRRYSILSLVGSSGTANH